MTDSKTPGSQLRYLDRLEALCRDGATFEQALAQIGFADRPLGITALLFKYWKILEMEHAFNAAKIFYDRFLELEDAR
jgi:hypothetical protein